MSNHVSTGSDVAVWMVPPSAGLSPLNSNRLFRRSHVSVLVHGAFPWKPVAASVDRYAPAGDTFTTASPVPTRYVTADTNTTRPKINGTTATHRRSRSGSRLSR